MKIIDITEKLLPKIQNDRILNNHYCFNPSIAHYRDNIYLCVYRSINYNIDKKIIYLIII